MWRENHSTSIICLSLLCLEDGQYYSLEKSVPNGQLKVPISSKFLFSYLILYLTQWTAEKEKFDLDKMRSVLEILKTFKFAAILVHHSHQSSLRFEWVVTYIQEHVTSGLTYLACFTSVS